MPQQFRKLMGARFFFTFAVQMQAVVLGWQMYDLTQSALCLGLIGLAEALPALSLGLYAGVVVDRGEPLRIYRNVILVSFASGLVMLLTQTQIFSLSIVQQVTCLYGAACLTGLARGFSQPSMFAIVPRLVERAELPRASAWMASTMQVARISGPAVGGLVFGWFGMATSSSIVCLSLIGAWLSVMAISLQPLSEQKSQPTERNLKREVLSGLEFVFSHPILLPALSLDMISVLFGGVTALLPIYASEILHVGPKGLGLLRASAAIGAAITSLSLTRLPIKSYAGPLLLTAVAGFGISIFVFGISTSFYVSVVALALSGAFDSVSMVIRSAVVQLSSPDHMRGRISSVNSLFIGSSNELGELESGLMASWIGTVETAVFGSIMCLATVAATAVLSKPLRTMRLPT